MVRSQRNRIPERISSRKVPIKGEVSACVSKTTTPKTRLPSKQQQDEGLEPNHALVGFYRVLKRGNFKSTTYTVAHKSFIEGDFRENEHVKVRYNNELFSAKIERISSDKKFLEALRKDLNDKIALCKKMTDRERKKSKKVAKSGIEKEIKDKEKQEERVSSLVESNINHMVKNLVPIFKPSSAASPVSEKKKISSPSTPSSNGVQPEPKTCDVDESSMTSAPPSRCAINMLVSVEERDLLLALRDRDVPKVTDEGLSTLCAILKFSKLLSAVQHSNVSPPSPPKVPMSDLEKRLHYITKLERNEEGTIVDDRVELVEGSGLYIDAYDKTSFTSNFLKKPNELTRRLLKNLLTPKLLAGMSVHGSREHPAIPAIVYNTVTKYVSSLLKADPDALAVYQKEIVSKINATCGYIRYDLGQSKSSPAVTKHGQPKQKAGRKKTRVKECTSSSDNGTSSRPPNEDDLPSKSQEGGIKRKGCINDTISHSDTQDGLNNNKQGVVKRKRADLLAEETLKQLEIQETASGTPNILQTNLEEEQPQALSGASDSEGEEEEEDDDDDDDDEGEQEYPSNLPTPTEPQEFNYDFMDGPFLSSRLILDAGAST